MGYEAKENYKPDRLASAASPASKGVGLYD